MSTTIGERITVGDIEIRFMLEGDASGGSVAVFEFVVPAGARVPIAHSHDGFEETIYGLEGRLTWTVGDRQVDVGKGDVLCIPRGVVHRFDNDHDADARMLAIVTPGVLRPDYFREAGAVLAAAAAAARPPDPAEFVAVMRRHGFTPAP